METFYPGDRVKVFDPRLFKDDKSTPISYTVRDATVVRWYGCRASELIGGFPYPSLVDVIFDYDGRLSESHFTAGIKHLIT